ncbi:esterase/lipase [Penicillium maclennaniae]|uniref:esterase/lipase n=1 Tax=Penicillium maclennaniae TaxID=1343394 RepID=UPI00253FCB71|nr:esterase/lipase [Penicillium maclennaniae]KAJ5681327.1 esterase/lipase [Penicillium maclennaniae]
MSSFTKSEKFPDRQGPMRASVFRPKTQRKPGQLAPGVLHIHGGGHCSGNRFMGLASVLGWVEEFGVVLVSAEYRLAPEHPQPAQLHDSYAALVWMSENAQELGISQAQIIVCGGSAGGNLAAGVVLLARDLSGPRVHGQLLMYPWLDDSNATGSMQQFGDIPPWTKSNSIDACNYALGVNREHATMYSVPSHAKDLGGLPPTFIDVGEADPFRDEDVDYASALWKAGVSTELHVWPGCWHGFDVFVPDAPISRRAKLARSVWLSNLIYGQ